MKGVSFTGRTKRAGKLLDEWMSKKLSLSEKMSMKVKKISEDPVTYHFIPRDKRILKAWKVMGRDDIEAGFILKAIKGQPNAGELQDEFRLEVLN